MKQHFDGWGHRTCDYFLLVDRFRGDHASMKVLRNFAPFRYVVLPDVEIRLQKGMEGLVEVVLFWPGESRRLCKKIDERAWLALRRLWMSGDLTWKRRKEGETFILSREGRVVENRAAVDYSGAAGGR